jgi:hypothetical protein
MTQVGSCRIHQGNTQIADRLEHAQIRIFRKKTANVLRNMNGLS